MNQQKGPKLEKEFGQKRLHPTPITLKVDVYAKFLSGSLVDGALDQKSNRATFLRRESFGSMYP